MDADSDDVSSDEEPMTTPAARSVYDTRAWRATSKAVRARDGRCVKCGSTENLSAHHSPLPVETILALGFDPYDPDACTTLCATCHGAEDGGRKQRKPKNANRFMTSVTRANGSCTHGSATRVAGTAEPTGQGPC